MGEYKPTPEEVLAKWDDFSPDVNPDAVADALREAIRQRDEALAALKFYATCGHIRRDVDAPHSPFSDHRHIPGKWAVEIETGIRAREALNKSDSAEGAR